MTRSMEPERASLFPPELSLPSSNTSRSHASTVARHGLNTRTRTERQEWMTSLMLQNHLQTSLPCHVRHSSCRFYVSTMLSVFSRFPFRVASIQDHLFPPRYFFHGLIPVPTELFYSTESVDDIRLLPNDFGRIDLLSGASRNQAAER